MGLFPSHPLLAEFSRRLTWEGGSQQCFMGGRSLNQTEGIVGIGPRFPECSLDALQARAVGLVGSDQKEEMSALEGQVARLGQRVGTG